MKLTIEIDDAKVKNVSKALAQTHGLLDGDLNEADTIKTGIKSYLAVVTKDYLAAVEHEKAMARVEKMVG